MSKKSKGIKDVSDRRTFRLIHINGQIGCPFCSPNLGCNRNRGQRSWKKHRNFQWKQNVTIWKSRSLMVYVLTEPIRSFKRITKCIAWFVIVDVEYLMLIADHDLKRISVLGSITERINGSSRCQTLVDCRRIQT